MPRAPDPILYYAPGGGLGHMRRAAKLAQQLDFGSGWVLAASAAPALARWLPAGAKLEIIPAELSNQPAALREWINALLARLAPSALYVDAFPGGLFGECCGLALPAGMETIHVARLLDWARYAQRLTAPLPRFNRILMLEPLHHAHQQALEAASSSIQPLILDAPVTTDVAKPDKAAAATTPNNAPLWLIAHSEPLDEVHDLLAYAQAAARAEHVAPRFAVISACAGTAPGVEWHADADAIDWYPRASRLFTAAGFNTLHETRPWRQRQHIMPMPRALDDQFERARRERQL